MTRINSAIAVRNLTDEHLLAEHREIKRLPACLLKSLVKGVPYIPNVFTLGKGHVSFFYNKFEFTLSRYKDIYIECLKRGFDVTNYITNWLSIGDNRYWNGYTPTEIEREILVERISERIRNSKKTVFHYYGRMIDKDTAIKLLKQ